MRFEIDHSPILAAALVLLTAVGLGGCSANSTIQPQFTVGAVSNSVDENPPRGTVSAYIYEIDGEPVHWASRTFSLTPGVHTIRVWPVGPAQRMVPDMEMIEREAIEVDALELEVVAGYRYVLAAEWIQSREVVTLISEEYTETIEGEWMKTVQPVVIRTLQPPTWEAAAEGAAGFFGSLLLGPLLGGGAAFGG